MSKLRIELNREGVRSVLKSAEMQAIIQEHANRIAAAAGDGFETSAYTGQNRVNVSVRAETKEAIKACMDDNVLLKVIR